MSWIESISDQPLIKLVLMLVVCKWRKQLSLQHLLCVVWDQNSRIESLPATLEFSLAKWLLWSLLFRFVVPTELLPPLLWKTVAAGVQHWKEPGSGWEDVGRGRGCKRLWRLWHGWWHGNLFVGVSFSCRRKCRLHYFRAWNESYSVPKHQHWFPEVDAVKWRELGAYSCKSSSRPTSGCVWNGGYPLPTKCKFNRELVIEQRISGYSWLN